MIRIVAALFLIAHGLVHLLWFVVPWNLMEVDGLPYSTNILSGRIDVGRGGIRFVGLLWVVAAVAFVVAGIALLFAIPWWWTATLGAALYSLFLCLLGLPVAKWGLLIDLVIMAILLLGRSYELSFLPFS